MFANSVKRPTYDVKNSQLGHDLQISVNGRMISPLRNGFIFTNKILAKISEFTVCL